MFSSISPNFWDGLSLDLELCSPVRLDLLVMSLLVSICLPPSMPAMELWTGSIQLSFYVGYKDRTQVLSSVYQALPTVQSPQHPVRWLLRHMCTTIKHAMNTRYVNFPGAVVSRAPQTKCIRTVGAYPCSVLEGCSLQARYCICVVMLVCKTLGKTIPCFFFAWGFSSSCWVKAASPSYLVISS